MRIFKNAKIYSMDKNDNVYEAVAVDNGRISFAGTNEEVLKKYLPIADDDDVEFNFARKENTDIMEMSVSLEKADEKTALKIDSKEDALK